VNRSACRVSVLWGTVAALGGCGDQAALGGADQNGKAGGSAAFDVSVTDDLFTPSILKTENLANVTLALTNHGTKPHGFSIRCLGTTCFPDAAKIAPLPPDGNATVVFETPYTEGIYDFDTNVPGEAVTGQFIVQ
jgi:hypothetical protein